MTDKDTIDEGARIVAGVRLKSMDFNGDTLRLEEADGKGGRVHVTNFEPAGEAVYDVMQGRPLLVISGNRGKTPTRVQVTALGSALGAVRVRRPESEGGAVGTPSVIQRDGVEPGERSDRRRDDNAKIFELDAATVLVLTVDGEAETVTPELVWPPEPKPEPEPEPEPEPGDGKPKDPTADGKPKGGKAKK